MTTVRSPKTLSRNSIATLMGATRSTDPRRWSRLTHTTSSSRCSRTRELFSNTSSIAARATLRAPSGSTPGLGLELGLHLPGGVPHPGERQRERVGYAGQPPLGQVVEHALEEGPGVLDGLGGLGETAGPLGRRELTMAEVISSVIVEVTRSTSSWPSSTTSTSCSGSIWRPSKESIAMNEWLVTMTSTSLAASRERSTKQSANGRALAAHALVGADRHLAPGPLAHPGHQLVAVAGLGLVRPLAQPDHLLRRAGDAAGRPAPTDNSAVLVVGEAALELVGAQVVASALDQPVGRAPAEKWRDRPRPGAACHGRRSGPAGRGSRWRRRPACRSPRRASRPGSGRPATCPCRCPPARAGARPWRGRPATAWAISTWPGRSTPPTPWTAACNRSSSEGIGPAYAASAATGDSPAGVCRGTGRPRDRPSPA